MPEMPWRRPLQKNHPNAERQAKVTNWLKWLESASYQQNIRFLNDQNSLRKALCIGRAGLDHLLEPQPGELRRQMKDKLALSPLPKGPSTRLRTTTKLQVWALGRNSSPTQREKAIVMTDFISKPWAQKTYALAGLSSLPVNRKAAKVVAAKIPGGTAALVMYAQQSIQENAAEGQSKARVFRDPARYQSHLRCSAGHHLRREFSRGVESKNSQKLARERFNDQ